MSDEVSTGSGSDRVCVCRDHIGESYPVATAPGTDFMAKTGAPPNRGR